MQTTTYMAKKLAPGTPYPTQLHPGIFYIEHDQDEKPVRVALLCPCGCTTKYDIPLTPINKQVRWQLQLADLSPTLTPSIDHKAGCLSHFSVTNGEVIDHKAKSKPKKVKTRG